MMVIDKQGAQITLREMEEKDVEQVTALEAACFSQPWLKQDFIEILTNPNRIYLVATEKNALQEDTILGGCMLTHIVGEGDISNVAVWEAYRKRGIASALLQELLQIGMEKYHMNAFTLEVRQHNEAAIRLYEKAGFISEGIRPDFYDKPKDNAVIMWKRI